MCSRECTGGAWIGDTSDASCHCSRSFSWHLPLACHQKLKGLYLVTDHKHRLQYSRDIDPM